MACVPAPTCKAALAEATKLWSKRNKASDGICGDAKHQARKSDHNLGNAFDLTHDPANNCDAHKLAREVAKRRDARIKYIISNRKIWYPATRVWIPYFGSNPHVSHAHFSIKPEARNAIKPSWWGTPKKVKGLEPKPVTEIKTTTSTATYKEDQMKATTFNVKLDGKGNKVFLRKDVSRKRVVNVTFGSDRKRAPRWTLKHDAKRKGTEFTFFDGQKNGIFEVTVWQASVNG